MEHASKKILLFITILLVVLTSTSSADDSQLPPRLPNGLTLAPAGPVFDVGNMPLSGILSPDGKIVLLLSGFREQGVQVFDPQSGKVIQTLSQPSAFFGLAFSNDGKTLYASGANEDLIYIYKWQNGSAELSGKIILMAHPQKNETDKKPDEVEKFGTQYPAGLALSKNGKYLYVAENLSDSLAVVDLKSGSVIDRKPAGHFPYAVIAAKDGRVYVSAWGQNIVTRYKTDRHGKLGDSQTVVVGRHPSALLLNEKNSRMYVASASTDSIAIVDTKKFQLIDTLKDSAPNVLEGSTPNALALSSDRKKLYVAEADSNAVAVFQLSGPSSGTSKEPNDDRLLGRIPVGWYPTALVPSGEHLYVVNGKGRGTRANPTAPQQAIYQKAPTEYTLGQLNGTIIDLPKEFSEAQLVEYSAKVAELNNWRSTREIASYPPTRSMGKGTAYPPFKHVLYIIKENRTYDQVFGDLPQGDGDPSLVFFPRSVSPNHHALAERFGLYDRFFVNAEVSSQGHPWSTSAYVTDFREKTVHSTYSGRRNEEPPSDDASDPATGYLWDLATSAKVSLRVYGEYAELAPDSKTYRSTKQGAMQFTSPTYPSYNLAIQDQVRADAWISELNEFVAKGEMPALQIFHLPNDHTAGARAGMATPASYMADNDLALGRMIEALSRSPFWKDTIVFVVEDDSQSGPDHVDSHRSVLLVISAYNRPDVSHRFVNTTDVIATLEGILNVGSLSQFDYYGRPLQEVFIDQADMTPYTALTPEQSLTEMNPEGENAKNSLKLNLEKEDLSDDETFNRILWAAIKGSQIPFPEERHISLLQLQQEK